MLDPQTQPFLSHTMKRRLWGSEASRGSHGTKAVMGGKDALSSRIGWRGASQVARRSLVVERAGDRDGLVCGKLRAFDDEGV